MRLTLGSLDHDLRPGDTLAVSFWRGPLSNPDAVCTVVGRSATAAVVATSQGLAKVTADAGVDFTVMARLPHWAVEGSLGPWLTHAEVAGLPLLVDIVLGRLRSTPGP